MYSCRFHPHSLQCIDPEVTIHCRNHSRFGHFPVISRENQSIHSTSRLRAEIHGQYEYPIYSYPAVLTVVKLKFNIFSVASGLYENPKHKGVFSETLLQCISSPVFVGDNVNIVTQLTHNISILWVGQKNTHIWIHHTIFTPHCIHRVAGTPACPLSLKGNGLPLLSRRQRPTSRAHNQHTMTKYVPVPAPMCQMACR